MFKACITAARFPHWSEKAFLGVAIWASMKAQVSAHLDNWREDGINPRDLTRYVLCVNMGKKRDQD